MTSEQEEVTKTNSSERVLRWDVLETDIERLIASEASESVKVKSEAGAESFAGFEKEHI